VLLKLIKRDWRPNSKERKSRF